MRRTILGVLVFFALATVSNAGTEVSLWRSYTNEPSGQIHFAFDLKNYKRGAFFGSCGMSTRSLQWEYDFDLKGKAPPYGKDAIEVKDGNFHALSLDSGNIAVNTKNSTVEIAIKITTNGIPQNFIGNGTYRLRR